MKKVIQLCIFLSILFLIVLGIFMFFNTSNDWSRTFKNTGTLSSCRAIDLNGDQILDIVIGAGGKEFESSNFGVIALNGLDGSILWKVPSRNQMVGTPVFMDITNDNVPEVFIGGRSAQLLAINGKSGKIIWEFLPTNSEMDLLNDPSLLNFFSPQLIKDQDKDGIKDLLVSFGGFVKALPTETDRPPGYLMIVSGVTGHILSKAESPDGKEIYMSPLVHDFDRDGMDEIIFGTGGETIDGSLFLTSIVDLLTEDLSKSKKLASGNGKGFIAPPVLVDITNDRVLDIISNSANGRTIAIDGKSNVKLWEFNIGKGYETYSSVVPISVNHDSTIDFFVSFGKGEWPIYDQAAQILLDGKTGSELQRYNYGSFQYASPIVYDITEDGKDDVLYVVNLSSKNAFDNVEGGLYRYTNALYLYDVQKQKASRIGQEKPGANLGSTPLLTDIEGNGYIDIITCRMTDQYNIFSFQDLVIERKEMKIKVNSDNLWGEYMGKTGKSILEATH